MFVFWKIISILPLCSLLDFFSWNLDSYFHESWNQTSLDSLNFWLNLEITLLGFLSSSFVIIKTTWINLIHHHEAYFYTIVPSTRPSHEQQAHAPPPLSFSLSHSLEPCLNIYLLMQSYPPRAFDRRLQEDWARDAREGPKVLMSLRVDFGLMG